MGRPLSENVRAAVIAAKHRGMSEPQALAEVRKAGHRVSAGSVHNIYAADAAGAVIGPRGGAKGQRVRRAPPAPPSKPSAAPEAPAAAPGEDDPVALLRRQVEALEKLAAVAAAEGRLSEFSTLCRTAQQGLALAARLAPPERPDPNDNPDMRAMAEAAVRRLHELVDLVAGEK